MTQTAELVDKLTFERAEQHTTANNALRGGKTTPHLQNAYLMGTGLADEDAASKVTRSAAQVIEYGLSEAHLDDFDAVSNFVAGYNQRRRWLTKNTIH